MNTHRQAGMSAGGWFLVVVLVLSGASVGLSTVPAYLEHNTLVGVIESLLETPKAGQMNEAEFRKRLQANLKLNNIRDLNLKEMVEFERTPETVKVVLSYEVREHLFSNVDVVMSFEEEFEKIINRVQ